LIEKNRMQVGGVSAGSLVRVSFESGKRTTVM
jgi:hypothetical protein